MTDRERLFNIVMNKSAESYNNIDDILSNLKNVNYAYIVHNKDITNEGEPKAEHKHLILEFTNARTFKSISNYFKGAHIEKILYLKSSIEYLTHKNDKAKYQYNDEDIITNNKDWLNSFNKDTSYPLLTEQKIIDDIMEMYRAERLTEALCYFYITYGNDQVKKYRQMIIDLVKDSVYLSSYLKLKGTTDKDDLPF